MVHRFVVIALVVLFLAFVVEGLSPPHVFPLRARRGELYRASLEHHKRLNALHGLYRNTTVNYFTQLIDHSDPVKGTFQQRYWVDDSSWDRNNGPCFIYIGGEGPEGGSPEGFPAVVGKNESALLITLEHRYYGGSIPAPFTDKETLRTLKVESTMADYDRFMTHIEQNVAGRALRWVAVGGSYAGALSAWLKVTFPDRFVASWSSSGVVNARFDYTDFDGHLVQVLPTDCLQSLRDVMGNFSIMYDDPSQQPILKGYFGTPDYFTKSDMAWMMADASAMAVQYGSKLNLCKTMVPEQPTANGLLYQYASFVNNTWGPGFGANCYYSTKCLSDPMMQNQWTAADYGWVFQCCNELAYWQVSYPNSLRAQAITSDYYINQCRSAFWPTIFSDTFKFNAKYGGDKPKATNVIALQGSDDPWSTAGVTSPLGPSYPEYTAVCDGCGHCGDLGAPSPQDPAVITAQRQFIQDTLHSWLIADKVKNQKK